MGVQQNIGTVTANISGSVAAAPPGTGAAQTIVHVSADGTGGNATLYTVPANKVLYIIATWCENFAGAAAAPHLQYSDDSLLYRRETAATNSSSYTPGCVFAKFTAGTNVRYAAAVNARVGISGWLEDA